MTQQATKKAVKKVQRSALSKDVKELHKRYQDLLINTYGFVIQQVHTVLHCLGPECFNKSHTKTSVCMCKCAQCRNGIAFLVRLDRRLGKIKRR